MDGGGTSSGVTVDADERAAVVVEVFTRDGCRLCEVAERRAADEAGGAEVRFVDVDADGDLQRRYGHRVPVVAVAGREIAQYEVAVGAVRAAVARARSARRARDRDPPARDGEV